MTERGRLLALVEVAQRQRRDLQDRVEGEQREREREGDELRREIEGLKESLGDARRRAEEAERTVSQAIDVKPVLDHQLDSSSRIDRNYADRAEALEAEVRGVKSSLDAWCTRAEIAEARLLRNIAEPPSSPIAKSEPESVTASTNPDVKPAINTPPRVDRTRLEEAEAVLTGVRSEMESYRAKCGTLEEELETAREQVEEVMGEMEGLQSELREARERPVIPAGETEQRNETGSNAAHDSADDKVQQRISDLERENASLLAERVELLRRNVTVQRERADAWIAVEDSLRAQEVLRERADEMARRVEEKDRAMAALHMQRDDAKRELEELKVELDLDGVADKARTNRAKDDDGLRRMLGVAAGPSGIPITVGNHLSRFLTPLTSCTVPACSRVPLARDACDHRLFPCGT